MTNQATHAPPRDLPRTLLHVAWMSIVVGLILQLLSLALVRIDSIGPFIRDLSQKMSWSMFVCLGLALATAAAKTREIWMGLAGFLAAPISFTLARIIQRGVGSALGLAGGANSPIKLLLALLAIKAIEYALFGFILGQLSTRHSRRASHYLALGLSCGLLFSTAIVTTIFFLSPNKPAPAQLLSTTMNEVLFPISCAMILYTAELLAWNKGK